MPISLNTTLRNARAAAIVTEAGSGAKLAVKVHEEKMEEEELEMVLALL